ncbi:MAG: hypothetical protein VXV85_06985, partial [Candidatus Thermoplasmatota archaeon]|nr:hypothetical protein [Candidatus Thermoplasmatota archaeon]
NKLTNGNIHACAVLGNGSLMCWGDDSYGQTGANGNTGSSHNLPAWVDLGAGRSAVAVGAGGRHTCVILDNGSLMCMGADNDGQVGDGASWPQNNNDKITPVHIDLGSGRTAVAVAGGNEHTCGILDNGSLMCWGEDDFGQLGDNSYKVDESSPVLIDVGAGRSVIAVSGGNHHTCVVLDNGSMKCWGRSWFGALGNGATSGDVTTPPSATVDLGLGRTAVAVSAGGAHTCAILDDGSVKCWGSNNNGQLGLGNTAMQTTPPTNPIDLGIGRTAVAIAAGNEFTCATLDNGSLMCWGDDFHQQLGNGASTSYQDDPIFVGGGHTWDNSTGLSSGSGSFNTLTGNVEGAEVLVGLAMTDITFEYIGPTTYGNYSTWQATNINSPPMSMPGANMQILVGDTFYFDASDQNGTELWAYDTSNHSEWRVDDINSGLGPSYPGVLMELLVGDTLYFSADDGTTGRELWAYNTSNNSVPWQVADINSGGGHSDPGK